jgi:hypothetical protein
MDSLIPYLSLAVSLAAVAVSYYCFRLALRRSVKPVLVFSHEGQGKDDKSVWHVENVGNGPAINVILAGRNVERQWKQSLILPALATGSRFRLTWITHTGALVAIYSDSSGGMYTTECFDSRNRIFAGNRFPGLEPIKASWQITKDEKGA